VLFRSFPCTPTGIPLFAEQPRTDAARVQQAHYDRIASAYLNNLAYPHTQEFMAYFDRKFLEQIEGASLETVAEICCGSGEALDLLGDRVGRGVGVDISPAMLESAQKRSANANRCFVQADATELPLASGRFDAVVMLGGIHHINDRARLFGEIARVLKPDGRFAWREPVDDFALWRWLRAAIYRLSPILDAETEHPLRLDATRASLAGAGLDLRSWSTFGFLGASVLMNSDVLVVNRLFRFVPGIRPLTRLMTRVDDGCLKLPRLGHAGLAVAGFAVPVRNR